MICSLLDLRSVDIIERLHRSRIKVLEICFNYMSMCQEPEMDPSE
jgi:hypothetical protein